VSGVNWLDRAIGIALVAVLGGLAAFGAYQNAPAPSPAAAGPLAAPGTTAAPAVAGVTVPAVATTSTTAPAPDTTTTVPVVAGPVSVVGDSILLDIQPELSTLLPGVSIDGQVSRQFAAGIDVVRSERAAGTLGRVLVVELGTNGAVTSDDVDAMMQAAAGVARVVFVNVCVPRDWAAGDNAVLAAGVARYPGLAVLADWNALATPHPEWFTADQVHLDPAGAAALATLVAADA
jgi:hypothetical protein